MLALGFRAVGLDLSPAMARIAHLYTQAPIVVGDLRALPFADRMFKGAWAAASMLHLRREDFGIAILEARRVLAVDGLLFLSMKLGEGESQDCGRYVTYYDANELRALLNHACFEVLELNLESSASSIQKDLFWNCTARRK